MKAIILASGRGERLRPLTDQVPKPLIQLGGETILDHQLKSLIGHGINRMVVTTGPLREQIEQHVLTKYSINVEFIHNPRFEATNYIYTLWLARKSIDDDIILLHGDLLFEDESTD